MKERGRTQHPERKRDHQEEKVVNLAVYKIRRGLQAEGFDLLTDKKGRLTLVLRFPSR